MSPTTRRFGVLLAGLLIVVMLTIAASAAAKRSVTLKAASSTCKVGHSVKVNATVMSGSAYEVWIYKKVGSSWKKAVTATLVSTGHYVAYVRATSKGTMQLRAACVNSSGSVTAWSNVVSIKVQG